MKNRYLNLIALFLLMLITGLFWGTWLTLTRTIEKFSPVEFMHLSRVVMENVLWPMRIMIPAGVLVMLLSLIRHENKRSAGFYAGVGAFALLVGVMFVTIFVLVPIDRQIKSWTAESIATNWREMRDAWKMFHAIRTLIALGSFILFSWFLIDDLKAKNKAEKTSPDLH